MLAPFPIRSTLAVTLLFCTTILASAQSTGDQDWKANANLTKSKVWTIKGLGAIQGVSLIEGKIYVYGDVHDAKPRVGVIREFDNRMKPTGRELRLIRKGKAIITHPTGLTRDKKFGTFIGDTVEQGAFLHHIDWDRAWKDGNLDNALLVSIKDDVATNGCRPVFVTVQGVRYLATADYGGENPHLRLYDPEKLVKEKCSSAAGVMVHNVRCSPNNQNLAWDAKTGQITCVQNVVAGRGWRLDVLDLAKAIQAKDTSAPGARVRTLIFPPHSELEGFRLLGNGRGIFVTAARTNNVAIGTITEIEPTLSPQGEMRLELGK